MNLSLLLDSYRVLVFVGAQALIAVSNALVVRRLAHRPAGAQPRVSVLVPARDEAETLGACVWSLLSQRYPDFEVIVLDDGSTDRTREIAESFEHPRLRVVAGEPLPAGWTGKAWACDQLARLATGELLLFTDADTVHDPATLESAVASLESTRADLLTCITRNLVPTLGEQLLVPIVNWSIMTLLPVGLGHALGRSGAFSAANGKFMLFRRPAYDAIGGHASVRDDATEDLALCRLVKGRGFRWRLRDASDRVSARMYHGFGEAVQGFSKNLFALFGYRMLWALFVWCWLLVITWYPWVTLGGAVRAGAIGGPAFAALVTVGLNLATWLVVSVRNRLPLHLGLLHPFIITASAYVGLRSLVLSIAGRTTWKGRRLVRRKAKVI
jgi:chlorobactene glucosyltransferase